MSDIPDKPSSAVARDKASNGRLIPPAGIGTNGEGCAIAQRVRAGMTTNGSLVLAATGVNRVLLFLLKMGEMADGTHAGMADSIPIWDIGAEIAMSEIEAEAIASDLQEQALIAYSSLAGDIALTDLGRSELNLLYARPDTPTQRFPALLSLLNDLPVNIIDAGEPHAREQSPVTPIAEFVGELEACCGDLSAGQEPDVTDITQEVEPRQNNGSVSVSPASGAQSADECTDIPLNALEQMLDQPAARNSAELISELDEVASTLS